MALARRSSSASHLPSALAWGVEAESCLVPCLRDHCGSFVFCEFHFVNARDVAHATLDWCALRTVQMCGSAHLAMRQSGTAKACTRVCGAWAMRVVPLKNKVAHHACSATDSTLHGAWGPLGDRHGVGICADTFRSACASSGRPVCLWPV